MARRAAACRKRVRLVERADAWLWEPNAVLNGKPPIAVIHTTAGHRAVIAELKRLDYSR
ncbi:MAG: MbcA/ParS/Xre antitoxin family protein [Steroidobacteraceae bacterium]